MREIATIKIKSTDLTKDVPERFKKNISQHQVLSIMMKTYKTEYTENVGQFYVVGDFICSPYFDSVEEAQDYILRNCVISEYEKFHFKE